MLQTERRLGGRGRKGGPLPRFPAGTDDEIGVLFFIVFEAKNELTLAGIAKFLPNDPLH